MRLRSFHGETLAEAMGQVREALGPDAIIVATRDDDQGGVRVTAALDESTVKPTAPTPVNQPEPTPTGPIDYEHDVVETIADALMRHNVSAALAETMLGTVTHFADHDILIAFGAAMDKHFSFAPLFTEKSKPICLVGPPGAGKTLTIAKIAANRVLHKNRVGVITTDLTRAGAVEQLASLTRLLKIDLIEVEDPPALRDAIDTHKNGEVVLIDNTGRNPFSKGDMFDLRKMVSVTEMEPVLVLPAGLDAQEGIDMARAFMEVGARKMIVTKVDMTRRLGSMLSIAHETGMQLSDMSISPKVTEPLQSINPVTLARLLLPADVVSAALKSAGKSTGTA